MLGANGYKTKKELKAAIGKKLQYVETSYFGEEYKSNGEFTIVGPDAHTARNWFATVTMKDDKIVKVI